jgi:UPF0716 protein FxsA
LLFTLGPLIELTLLLKIGSIFGVWHTVALVVITGIVGAYLARDQGLKVIREFQESLAQGKIPTNPIVEGALILVAAALLVTPGVITDIIGFLFVIPQSRKIIAEFLRQYFAGKIAEGAYTQSRSGGFYHNVSFDPPPSQKKKPDKDHDVIDIE